MENTGCPKKNAPMFQTAITPTKMAQKSKVRWLLESACNSLSDEHWNFVIWTLGAWENAFKDGNPTLKIITK